MALQNQFQAHPNHGVSTTPLLVGFVFQPSMIDIFSYFLPRRLLVGQPIMPPPYDTLVRDIDLYGEMSPEQLFEGDDETEFYFFTTLKKQSESHKRVKRAAGGGTWDGDRFEDCKMVVQGKMTKVGAKKSFKFKKNGCNNSHFSWILHEYKMEKDYYIKTFNNDYNINPNIVENIVFCHVHKKVEKNYVEMHKKRKESFINCEEQRKRVCNYNLESTNLLLDNNNNESSTLKMDNNNNYNTNNHVNNQPILERIEISSDDEDIQAILNVPTFDDNNNNNNNVNNPPVERIEISIGDEDLQSMILNEFTFDDDDMSWEDFDYFVANKNIVSI